MSDYFRGDALHDTMQVLANTLEREHKVPVGTFNRLLAESQRVATDYRREWGRAVAEGSDTTEEEISKKPRVCTIAELRKELKNIPPPLDTNLAVEGKTLTDKELEGLFPVPKSTAVRRVNEDGAAPLLALTKENAKYKAMHAVDVAYSGWCQLCHDYGIPPTDQDICMDVHGHERSSELNTIYCWGEPLKRTGSFFANVHDTDGVRDTAWRLHKSSKLPKLHMAYWLEACLTVSLHRTVTYGKPETHRESSLCRITELLGITRQWKQRIVLPQDDRYYSFLQGDYLLSGEPNLHYRYSGKEMERTYTRGLYEFMRLVVQVRHDLRKDHRIMCLHPTQRAAVETEEIPKLPKGSGKIFGSNK